MDECTASRPHSSKKASRSSPKLSLQCTICWQGYWDYQEKQSEAGPDSCWAVEISDPDQSNYYSSGRFKRDWKVAECCGRDLFDHCGICQKRPQIKQEPEETPVFRDDFRTAWTAVELWTKTAVAQCFHPVNIIDLHWDPCIYFSLFWCFAWFQFFQIPHHLLTIWTHPFMISLNMTVGPSLAHWGNGSLLSEPVDHMTWHLLTAYHLAINSMKRNMHEHMIHASVPEDSAPEQSAFTVFTPTKSASTMEPSNLRQGFVWTKLVNLDAVKLVNVVWRDAASYCRIL